MTERLWPDVGITGVLVVVALYCAARLVVPRWRDPGAPRYADLTHLAMAVVMIAIPAGAASPLWGGAVLVGFAAAAAWAFGRMIVQLVRALDRSGRAGGALGHLNLAVASAAMLYLATWPGAADPVRSVGHHHGAATSVAPLLGVVLVTVLVGLAVVSVGGLAASLVPSTAGGSVGGAATVGVGWPRRFTLCCHTAMGVAMAAMTVAML